MDDKRRLIPDPLVWQGYGVSPMTGWRWDHDPELNFPKPIRIRGRKYRDAGELAEFDERKRREAAERAAVDAMKETEAA
jgi:hypothetical protein